MFLLAIVLIVTVLLAGGDGSSERRALDQHVSHYEPLHYDADQLMANHHLMRRSGDGTTAGHIKLHFKAFGRDFDLRLRKDYNKHLDKNLKLLVDGEHHSKMGLESLSYIGHDMNDATADVHGNLAYGVFEGAIHTPDDIFYIEPADRYLSKHQRESHSIIYRQSDVTYPSQSSPSSSQHSTSCGSSYKDIAKVLEEEQQEHNKPFGKRLQKRQTTAKDSNKVNCKVYVIADHFFYNAMTSSSDSSEVRLTQVTSTIRNIVASTSKIFREIDFDMNGVSDNIQINIQTIQVNQTSPGSSSTFGDEFVGVESLLQRFSRSDWSAYCASYLFTYRDFDNGVLGLAYVAKVNGRGGICDDNLNTGIVTGINYGNRLSNAIVTLTFAHELGHNFGSTHDDTSNATCSPPGDNKYIMTALASTGSSPNNRRFSPCSIELMSRIVATRGQAYGDNGCFRLADDNCGNEVLDDGEDCDCGLGNANIRSDGICISDPCCNGTSCKLTNGVICSPQSAPCCSRNCSMIPMSVNKICQGEDECAYEATCNGSSVHCPEAEHKIPMGNESAIACNNGDNYCSNGQCIGSICVLLDMSDCECSTKNESCHLCCRAPNGTCVSTILLANESISVREMLPDHSGKYLTVGFPCSNFTGYCDFFFNCHPVNKEGPLTRITNFLSGEHVQTAINWLIEYWWAGVLMLITIIIGLFFLVLFCHCILPRPEHVKKRDERRKKIRSNLRGNQHERNPGAQMRSNNPDRLWINTNPAEPNTAL
jgi:disintegrin and metalloproteinase domain-containing protein 10